MAKPTVSPPTSRVLDVLEFLAERNDQKVRLLDLERGVKLTKATAHAIMTTLCDRHWVVRDPKDKTFSLGPAVSDVARLALPLSEFGPPARFAAIRLAADTSYNASVVELIGATQAVVVFDPQGRQLAPPGSSDRVELAAPFGAIFAAYDSQLARVWIERSGATDPALVKRLNSLLSIIRDKELAVERMSPVMVRAAKLGHQLQNETGSESMRQAMEMLLNEVATVGYLHDVTGVGGNQPVTSIAAPVFDSAGRAILALAVHPYEQLGAQKLARVADRVREAATEVQRGSNPTAEPRPRASHHRGDSSSQVLEMPQ